MRKDVLLLPLPRMSAKEVAELTGRMLTLWPSLSGRAGIDITILTLISDIDYPPLSFALRITPEDLGDPWGNGTTEF